MLCATPANSFAISRVKNSVVCNVLIDLEFVIQSNAFPLFVFVFLLGGGGVAVLSILFCTIAIFVPHHPNKNAILLGFYEYIHNEILGTNVL